MVNKRMDRNVDLDYSCGKMELVILVDLIMIKEMVWG